MQESNSSDGELHSSNDSVGVESDSGSHSSSSDYEADHVDSVSETSFSSDDEVLTASGLHDVAGVAESKGGEDGDEKLQKFLSRVKAHYKTNRRIEDKEAKRDFYSRRLEESTRAVTPQTQTTSPDSEDSSEESVSTYGSSESEKDAEEETEASHTWPGGSILASATSCITTSSPSMLVLRAVATGAAGLLGSVGAVGLAHRLEIMSAAPPISEDVNNNDSDGTEEDYVNLQRRSNLGMLSVRLFGRIISASSLGDAASMGASCAAYQGLVATHDIWKASFERCFSGRLSIFEEASSRLRQPQWRRLFLQRAVIAYAHIGALDDDDGRSNEAEVSTAAAVTNAPTKDIIDVLNCLQVAQQVQTQSLEGGVLYMCAAGSKLTLALNALKAAALEAISQIGPINQEEDSKVVVKDSREDSADERYTTSVSSFPLPYFDGLNVLGSLGSAAIIRMEKEATNDTSPLHFEATLLPEHATAVLLVVDPAAPPSELRAIANWIKTSLSSVREHQASKVGERVTTSAALDQTGSSPSSADTAHLNRALLILATYPSSNSLHFTVAHPSETPLPPSPSQTSTEEPSTSVARNSKPEVSAQIPMPQRLSSRNTPLPPHYRTPRELALALRLHELCGREWTHSDVLQNIPRNRLAAAKCAASGSLHGGKTGGIPWRLQPWTSLDETSNGKGRGLRSALRFLADVSDERMRFRSNPVVKSEAALGALSVSENNPP